jgi:transcriptional regulator with GAF, ATPase, and Fis domain/pSer/pThr/pTyr-binding forkhead associated (FHA) protein
MSPELIIINGPQAGARYPLGQGEFVIGRAPSSSLVLSEPEVSWRHCQIRQRGERFLVTDLRTSSGTYVNGMRSAERWLEEKDQIGVGRTIVLFRSGAAEAEAASSIATADTKPALLAACSLLFLFRALASSEGDKHVLQTQILRLIGDLIPNGEGILLIGATCSELHERYAHQVADPQADVSSAISHVCEEGAFEDGTTGLLAVPLYISGGLFGALLVRVQDREHTHIAVHLETLTAVSALASVGFEANREVEILRAENKFLQQQIAPKTGIVGKSPLLRRLLERVEKVAPHDTTVLITGESGTGKELIARALHDRSNRKDRPFIAVNCAALTETLFESELFGHEKGAFTGAIAMKPGLFELAQGGTIFLDEVGELAQGFQAKFLRVLQQREFFRVGGTQARPLDIRVIAATNRELGQDISEGRFREDLYHRLNVVALDSPPLRERKDDIPQLAEYFLQRSAEKSKRHVKGLSPEAMEMIMQYNWPGNVRELENAMERAVVLGDSDWVLPEDLPDPLLAVGPPQNPTSRYTDSVVGAKREAILDAYRQAKGDYRAAAKILNLHPNYLLRLVRNLRLRDEINRFKGQ